VAAKNLRGPERPREDSVRSTSVQLPIDYDVLAPDGSEIRLLGEISGGSFCHCTLPPGETSLAVKHRSVEEIWYFLSGSGEVWRKLGEEEEVVETRVGLALTIPLGTHFQFRNVGTEPLTFVIATIPAWPGEQEAERVADHWPV
jgi:mannose-6-phosphate isomerase-like protein (cupin superfamily)